MLGRLAALAVCVSLAACAGLEPAGRNAGRAPQPATPIPPPVAAPATPPPAPVAALPQPTAPTTPPQAAATPAPAPVLTVPPQARAPSPPPVTAAAPPPAAAPTTPPPIAAPTTPARAPVLTPQRSDDDIVVPGQREQQVLPPNGDPRSTSERMQDIRAWDRCVTTVQAAYERDALRPQMDTPEEYCSRSLGMANRDAIPLSRQERQR